MSMSRRSLLQMVGLAAGTTAMYQAMTTLGYAQPSNYTGPIRLEGDPQGAKVLILGAGLAGMTAALEMRAAGYEVTIPGYFQPRTNDFSAQIATFKQAGWHWIGMRFADDRRAR